ncbi:MAG TPA: hypothetical protein VNY08_12865 [Bradyrhizobium sp.]|jgi:hypothetical protein|nr:hypothetical protein [Bradyrhizobium sp.]
MTAFKRLIQLSAAFLVIGLASASAQTPGQSQPQAQPRGPGGSPANTLHDVFDKLFGCWKPPSASAATPMDITVRFSFNRNGEILGKPRITYESATATDNDRLAYRVAVMEALQRCTPMPFTETLAAAIPGHPFAVQFRTHLQSQEKRAWLPTKIL